MHFLEVKDFLSAAASYSLFDLRPLPDYRKAHISGAHALPYDIHLQALKQEYRSTNFIKVQNYVKNLQKLEMLVMESLTHSRPLLLYCQNGGLRSFYFQQLFKAFGKDFRFLLGGYKAYEAYREAAWQQHFRWVVLQGKTGSGKTRLLRLLARRGEQVIDLEQLAKHRGSVFGADAVAHQPTPTQFYNDLMAAWCQLDPRRPVFIEQKGLCLGRTALPHAVQNTLQQATCITLDVSLPERLRHIQQEYKHLSENDFRTGILRLSERLGRKNTLAALHALEKGETEEMLTILINYYDQSIRYQPYGKRLFTERMNLETIVTVIQQMGKSARESQE